MIGDGLLAYGLIYPVLGFVFGLQYPRMPFFAVPCPTTLVTAGWLLAGSGLPRVTRIAPVLWAAVGSYAAVALGIRADLALVGVGILLVVDTLVPSAFGAEQPVP